MSDAVPSLLLGPGFLGGWRRPVGLRRAFRPALGSVFAGLRDAVSALPPDGVVAGYLGYEVAAETEAGLVLPAPPDGLPPAWFGVFERTEAVTPPSPSDAAGPSGEVQPAEGEASYQAKVAEIVRRIVAGDLFQANLSRRLSATFSDQADLAEVLFARLCVGTDAPYAALVELSEGAVLSASPELFLSVEGDRVTAEPIKGTRPRGATPPADAALAEALAADPKDRAENVMIADLMRNDLSKVARDGSVVEEAVCALRTLPRVHHLYSRVTANLREGLGPVDALEACFPCGSITGAPKPAAMEAIAGLEGEGRGPYCGTVFAITAERAVFSVPIRTGVLTRAHGEARLDVRTGGGVTVLSDPAAEWAETVDKAYPFQLMVGG